MDDGFGVGFAEYGNSIRGGIQFAEYGVHAEDLLMKIVGEEDRTAPENASEYETVWAERNV